MDKLTKLKCLYYTSKENIGRHSCKKIIENVPTHQF